MLFNLLYPLHETFSGLNVFKYITFRTFGAAITAILICLTVGPAYIDFLKRKQMGQAIRSDGPQSHLSKKGTPTMGGGLILIGITVSTLLWSDLGNPYVWVALLTTLAFAILISQGAVPITAQAQQSTSNRAPPSKSYVRSAPAVALNISASSS
jgi:phospho-N-acetylmuramoyl-pentapeptide-transferase